MHRAEYSLIVNAVRIHESTHALSLFQRSSLKLGSSVKAAFKKTLAFMEKVNNIAGKRSCMNKMVFGDCRER